MDMLGYVLTFTNKLKVYVLNKEGMNIKRLKI